MREDHPRALVTGASRGIGTAIARALGPTHDLLLGGRDVAALEELAATLPSARPWAVELTDRDAVARATERVDRLDVLVHSAGIWVPGSIAETTPETWRRLFDVNVVAAAELTRRLLPALRSARGRIVFVNSTVGQRVAPGRGAYRTSKIALGALADAVHAEEAGQGVRVTTLYTGRVDTDMQRQVREYEGGPYEPDRYLSPGSVAEVVLWVLNSPPDSDVTEVVVHPAMGTRSAAPSPGEDPR